MTGTTRSGCGCSGSTITSARARYSLGSHAITRAARANTAPPTTAIHFQRRFIAPRSSSTVYVRSIRSSSERSEGPEPLPGEPQLHHVAVHLRHQVPVVEPRVAQPRDYHRPLAADAVLEGDFARVSGRPDRLELRGQIRVAIDPQAHSAGEVPHRDK